jgi:predicted HicB family RNase H-like nuclease
VAPHRDRTTLRLPADLRKALEIEAERQNTTLNTLIVTLLTEARPGFKKTGTADK